jgi:hypothetical protein
MRPDPSSAAAQKASLAVSGGVRVPDAGCSDPDMAGLSDECADVQAWPFGAGLARVDRSTRAGRKPVTAMAHRANDEWSSRALSEDDNAPEARTPGRLLKAGPQSPAASPAASNSTVTILMVMCAAMDTATLRLRQAVHVIGRNPTKIAGYRHGEKKW